MKPGPLEIVRPRSVEEAVDMLGDGTIDARVLAGGQSLVPMLNLRIAAPERLVHIGAIEPLRACEDLDDSVRIGALITHAEVQHGRIPDPSLGLLPAVAARIAYQPVRNRGTFGGSLSLADPAADWPAVCVALDAEMEWTDPAGRHVCAAADFFLGPYNTRLGTHGVLSSVRIPRLPPDARWGRWKLVRKAGEYADAMAIVVRRPGACRAVLGATGGTPRKLVSVEAALAGLRAWSDDAGTTLGKAFDADVDGADSRLNPVHAWQLRTCLIRAAAQSFGVDRAAQWRT